MEYGACTFKITKKDDIITFALKFVKYYETELLSETTPNHEFAKEYGEITTLRNKESTKIPLENIQQTKVTKSDTE